MTIAESTNAQSHTLAETRAEVPEDNQVGAPSERVIRAAVRRLLHAVDDCHEVLQCCRLQEGSTCLHRARRYAEERLCRTCRLVSAVEDLEVATF